MSILERSNRKDSALSNTPLDSIRRAIARRNGVADPAGGKVFSIQLFSFKKLLFRSDGLDLRCFNAK